MGADALAPALDVTVRLVAAGVAISGVELIVDRSAFGRAGPFGSQVHTVVRGARPPRLLDGPRPVAAVAVGLVSASLVLAVVGPSTVAGRVSLVAATLALVLLRWRRVLGGDGAEQLSVIVLVSGTLAFTPTAGDHRITLAVGFIAAEVVLAYLTAGVAKVASPVWRRGAALPGILRTHRHGLAVASDVVGSRPLVALGLGWGVIVFELLFPVVLIAPPPVAAGLLAAGLAFHVGCALLMGLNGFLWAFPATYACVMAARSSLVG